MKAAGKKKTKSEKMEENVKKKVLTAKKNKTKADDRVEKLKRQYEWAMKKAETAKLAEKEAVRL